MVSYLVHKIGKTIQNVTKYLGAGVITEGEGFFKKILHLLNILTTPKILKNLKMIKITIQLR